jgi:hypothetical protein
MSCNGGDWPVQLGRVRGLRITFQSKDLRATGRSGPIRLQKVDGAVISASLFWYNANAVKFGLMDLKYGG